MEDAESWTAANRRKSKETILSKSPLFLACALHFLPSSFPFFFFHPKECPTDLSIIPPFSHFSLVRLAVTPFLSLTFTCIYSLLSFIIVYYRLSIFLFLITRRRRRVRGARRKNVAEKCYDIVGNFDRVTNNLYG